MSRMMLVDEPQVLEERAIPQERPGAAGWAIEVAGLSRRYGSARALHGLDLTVAWDERVAVLGSNGAGKSTLLRILATLVRPTSGLVSVGGLSLPDHAADVRRHIGLVAHQTFLYDELTVRENLLFYGQLYAVPRLPQRVENLLERVGLSERRDARVRTLSRGLQQRAALARAILHDPPILFLDEPETGLDVVGADLISQVVRDDAGRRRTVLFTTHNLERAVELADRMVILANGKVSLTVAAAEATVGKLAAAIRSEGWRT